MTTVLPPRFRPRAEASRLSVKRWAAVGFGSLGVLGVGVGTVSIELLLGGLGGLALSGFSGALQRAWNHRRLRLLAPPRLLDEAGAARALGLERSRDGMLRGVLHGRPVEVSFEEYIPIEAPMGARASFTRVRVHISCGAPVLPGPNAYALDDSEAGYDLIAEREDFRWREPPFEERPVTFAAAAVAAGSTLFLEADVASSSALERFLAIATGSAPDRMVVEAGRVLASLASDRARFTGRDLAYLVGAARSIDDGDLRARIVEILLDDEPPLPPSKRWELRVDLLDALAAGRPSPAELELARAIAASGDVRWNDDMRPIKVAVARQVLGRFDWPEARPIVSSCVQDALAGLETAQLISERARRNPATAGDVREIILQAIENGPRDLAQLLFAFEPLAKPENEARLLACFAARPLPEGPDEDAAWDRIAALRVIARIGSEAALELVGRLGEPHRSWPEHVRRELATAARNAKKRILPGGAESHGRAGRLAIAAPERAEGRLSVPRGEEGALSAPED